MSDRCRACGAAVPADASWCSLCFADLRAPAPAVVREPAAVAAAPLAAAPAAPAAQAVFQPGPAVAAPSAAAVEALTAPDPRAAPAAAATVPTPGPTWPCPRCGAAVSMALDACSSCGAGFLAGAVSSKPVRLPVVGDVSKMSTAQRLAMGIGIGLAVMVVLVGLAFVGGQLFG